MRYIIALLLTSTSAMAEVPKVVTDIPPVHALVAMVMGDLGQPELLLAPGASEHDFQLRPSQAQALSQADLVVRVGPELTPWLERPLGLRPEGAATLSLLASPDSYLRDYGQTEAHDHADHDDHAEHEGHEDHEGHDHDDHGHDHDHDHEGHSHSGTDPHAWLDPVNGLVWLRLIAAELGRIDPENAPTYTGNAAAAAERIATADAEAEALLAPFHDRPIAVFHDAYGYFTSHYDLAPAVALAGGDAVAPGAKRVSELRARVEAGEFTCLFPEAQHDPKQMQILAEGTGAKLGGALDPVGSTLEPGPELYPALILRMAQTIADCLK